MHHCFALVGHLALREESFKARVHSSQATSYIRKFSKNNSKTFAIFVHFLGVLVLQKIGKNDAVMTYRWGS